ncbi:LysR family transcriptional regulator [Sneathiella aquimaris]|uniref:LysR family transcriptional regulator n=1 Tax=Sneathiella aquimaris TaxID=2599305 RepID=UPI00146A565B|nr:LysR family transcriptional regulator [Sneathiella aquimaris]
MSLRRIDLNLFVVFQVIYDAGNLTQAAERLNVTQPAVSNALARLREQFQDPLFVHARKRMNPTAAADELIGPVRQALGLLEGSIAREEDFDPRDIKKVLRLSIGDVGEAALLPEFMSVLREKAPQIKIQAYQWERRQLARKLAASEIDFAIDIPMAVEGQLRQARLLNEHHVCAVRNDHFLSAEPSLDLEQYLSQEHIHVSSRRTGGGVADLALSKLGKVRNNAVRLQHYQAAFALLERSDFVLTTPLSLTNQYPCRIFELPFDAPDLELQLYWHASSERSGVSNWIRQTLIEAAHRLLKNRTNRTQE